MTVVNDNTIAFSIRNHGSVKGWVGVGFGGKIMVKTDYHLFTWIDNDFIFTDSWSDDYDYPSNDEGRGGNNDIKDLVEFQDGNDRIVTYTRAVNTGDQYDHVFVSGNNPFVTAWWDNSPVGEHGSFAKTGSIQINFNTKMAIIDSTRYIMWEVHGIDWNDRCLVLFKFNRLCNWAIVQTPATF